MAPTIPDSLPLYGVQLTDAYLLDARVARRQKREGDVDGPVLEASLGGWHPGESPMTVDVVVAVKTVVPYRDGHYYLEIECSVDGRFVSEDEREPAFWEAFATREALAVLWPYLRSSAAELGRMTGLPVPVLPTLDVQAIVPGSSGRGKPIAAAQKRSRSRKSRQTATVG